MRTPSRSPYSTTSPRERTTSTWTAQRPWPARGNKAFDALVAPFLIDSYDLERAVLEDPIAEEMIASVNGSGLVGIGIEPGPLRFIAAHDPVRSTERSRGLDGRH